MLKQTSIKKNRQTNEKATMKRGFILVILVAGAGFEPTTFGL
jgi:hypothetical protein